MLNLSSTDSFEQRMFILMVLISKSIGRMKNGCVPEFCYIMD